MKYTLLLAVSFSSLICYAQNKFEGLLLDQETKEPIEFVNIFNTEDHTISNADGRFEFSSTLDSITFYRIGYKKLKTTFNQLNDTLHLTKSVFELNEVVVTNAKTIYQKIKDSIATNYLLEPHTETFFIRTILRRNDTIVRLQDMQGQVRRKTSVYAANLELEKNDFEITLKQMRQLGISKDQDNISFELPTVYNIFSEFVRLNAMGPSFDVTEKPYENSAHIKVEFSSNNPKEAGKSFGHYVINNRDNAILSFNVTTIPYNKPKTIQKTNYGLLLERKVSVFFSEDVQKQLYYINFAKRNESVEIMSKNSVLLSTYEQEIILYTTESLLSKKVKSNINEHKNLFKLKHPYNSNYWNTQNQLLLTEEMQDFITKMGQENSAFKVRSNMD